MNLKIREFKNAISNFVSQSELPDEVKRMVLSEILREQEERTIATIRSEIEERDRLEKGDDTDAESPQ